MSHFGLKSPLPVVEAAAPAEKVYYGLYEWQHRSYYDGGGSSDSEWLLAVHEDAAELRLQMNKIWESSDLFEGRGHSTQMAFKEGQLETNKWASDSGGCGASGGYRIKPVPTLSQHLAKNQARIDKAQAERDQRAEADRVWRKKQDDRAAEQRKWDAYYAERKVINAATRKKYAANKDEINTKRRAYRADVAAKKKAAEAEREALWNAFMLEYNTFCSTEFDEDVRDKMWYELHAKHYPIGTTK